VVEQIDIIKDKILKGTRINREEAKQLFSLAEFLELGSLANSVRKRQNPNNTVTFLIDRNINYTNVCNTDCTFCGFYRPNTNHPESYVLSKEILAKKIEETLEYGGSRILLQGGHNDELLYEYYIDLISWISKTYKIEINAFSPSEIQQMAKVSGKDYYSILNELKEAGLTGLPGGGAEILDDEVRKRVSPKKISADEWIEVMEVAQNLKLVTTASMVIGFGESLENRLNHLDRLRNLQDRTRQKGLEGFNMFISWTLQMNENTSMGRSRHADNNRASVIEYLKNIALCRIYLDNIQHHQSSWPTSGPEIAQIGLNFGCDDIGSTMMEENVVSQAGGFTQKQWCMSPEALQNYIRTAGYVPAQRNSLCEILKVY
jgi:cyclic dehypoxanthinyl futalosine synthase